MIRPILLHASFYVFLAQLWLYEKGWYWFEHTPSTWWARAIATIVLLALFLLLIVWGGSSRFEKTASMKGTAAFREIFASNWKSFIRAATLWMLCFAVWDNFYVFLRDVFMIAPIRQVIRASYALLTSGSMMANWDTSLWWDIAVSSSEIGELLLSGLIALMLVRVVESATRDTFVLAILFDSPYPHCLGHQANNVDWSRSLAEGSYCSCGKFVPIY